MCVTSGCIVNTSVFRIQYILCMLGGTAHAILLSISNLESCQLFGS